MSATMHLIKKELYLQKNNFLFAGILVILFIVISLLKISPLADIPFQFETLKALFEFLLYYIGLAFPCFLLPLMFGCSAASSETMYEVRPWQDSLPVSRKMAYLIKVVITLILAAGIASLYRVSYNLMFFNLTMPGFKDWEFLIPLFILAAVGLYSGSIANTALKSLIIGFGLISLLILVSLWLNFYPSVLGSLGIYIDGKYRVAGVTLAFIIFSYYNYIQPYVPTRQPFTFSRVVQLIIILIIITLLV